MNQNTPAIIDASNLGEVVVPQGNLILVADYGRNGDDLVLTGPDGTSVVLEAYFANPLPALLVSAGGARLSGETIMQLVESSGYSTQPAWEPGEPIGHVTAVEGVATARLPGGVEELAVGDPVYQDALIETGEGAVSISLSDGTGIGLSRNSRLLLDEFVFNPDTGVGKSAITVLQGVLAAVTGEIGKNSPDNVTIQALTGTIGIRGTTIIVEIDELGTVEITVAEGQVFFTTADGQVFYLDNVGDFVSFLTSGEVSFSSGGSERLENLFGEPAFQAAMCAASMAECGDWKPSRDIERQDIETQDASPAAGEGGQQSFRIRVTPEGLDIQPIDAAGDDRGEAPDAESEQAPAGEEPVAPPNDYPVNLAPVVSGPVALETPEDTALTIAASTLLANAADADGDPLAVEGAGVDSGGLTDNGDGTWTFTPDADFNGEATLNYRVSDGTDRTSATAAITVTPVNDAPEASGSPAFETAEDTALTIAASALLANAADADGDPLAVEGAGVDSGGLTDNGDGTWTFTPAADFNGEATLSYRVSDGTAQTSATAAITVTPVNDAPELSGSPAFETAEDTALTIAASTLLANAADADGDPLAVEGAGVDSGSLTDNGDGTWTFTPAADFNGEVTLSYRVSDGTAQTSATAAITVTPVDDEDVEEPVGENLIPVEIPPVEVPPVEVPPVDDVPANAPPVAGDVDLRTDEDTDLTIAESVLVSAAGDPDDDSLAVRNLRVDSGGLTDNGDGTWTFTPEADFNGDVGLSYDLSDGVNTVAATDTIVVVPVNDPPVVSGPIDLGTTAEDARLTIAASALLMGAADADGDPLMVENLRVDSGSLTDGGDGSWAFRPDRDFNGTVMLSYEVSDGTARTAATATVTVTPVNDLPVVRGGVLLGTIAEDTRLTVTASALLLRASDADGDPLTVEGLSANRGSLTDNGDGSWVFTPDRDFHGTATLSYRVSDGSESESEEVFVEGLAHITVTPVNDPPVPGRVVLRTNEDTALTIAESILAWAARDPDGDSLAVRNLRVDSGGLRDNGDGTWTFTPEADFNGDVRLNYDLSDGNDTVAATDTIVVTPVNDPPEVSAPLALEARAGTALTITSTELLANASDVDNDGSELMVTNLRIESPHSGSASLSANPDGTWTLTPTADFEGNFRLLYNVSDGAAEVETTATVTVDPPVSESRMENMEPVPLTKAPTDPDPAWAPPALPLADYSGYVANFDPVEAPVPAVAEVGA